MSSQFYYYQQLLLYTHQQYCQKWLEHINFYESREYRSPHSVCCRLCNSASTMIDESPCMPLQSVKQNFGLGDGVFVEFKLGTHGVAQLTVLSDISWCGCAWARYRHSFKHAHALLNLRVLHIATIKICRNVQPHRLYYKTINHTVTTNDIHYHHQATIAS